LGEDGAPGNTILPHVSPYVQIWSFIGQTVWAVSPKYGDAVAQPSLRKLGLIPGNTLLPAYVIVITPNWVALGQTVCTQVVSPKFWGC